jgi:hypothetical protein
MRTPVTSASSTRVGREAIVAELNRLWSGLRPTTPAIDAIAKLPFANVVTSVWDPLIDQAFAHRRPQLVTGAVAKGWSRSFRVRGSASCGYGAR